MKRLATRCTAFGLTLVHPPMADYWVWERTPLPCGPPTWGQILEGIVMPIKWAFHLWFLPSKGSRR